jgi:hypothetical protein
MSKINFYKVTSVPSDYVADSIYAVAIDNPTYPGKKLLQIIVTDSTGAPRVLPDPAFIEGLIDKKLLESSNNLVVFYPTYSEANTARSSLKVGSEVFVVDATQDPTVSQGSAKYVVSQDHSLIKIFESESIDLKLTWSSLTGKPTSSVSDIDDAVRTKHEHTNLATLNKISESPDGKLVYNGSPVGGELNWTTKSW